MKIFSKSLFLFLLNFSVLAQTPISGVINEYAKVVAIQPCEGKLTLEGTISFEPGDTVLIMQMKGATIDESDSNLFGEIEEIGSAGMFEKNEIESIVGNDVFLKYTLINNFQTLGSVQIISFPTYQNATVTDTIGSSSWDGEKGGVLVFNVENELVINAPILADGKGFRGGQTNLVSSDCSFLTNANDYFYGINNWRGAPKGEGIAAIIGGKEQGRGAQANGGGGGNDHNAGGGGGSNITSGGGGGKTNVGGFGCDGEFPGVGGKSLPAETNRIYFGGGGGAGHDNNGVGTNGGNGGGIIIISANSIIANGQKISANGISAATSGGDGSGGGGAGGTIILNVNYISGFINIELTGGNGGDQNNPSDRCIGAGGGGSGGRLLTNLTSGFITNLAGGAFGENLNPSNQCSNDPANGAMSGQDGVQSVLVGIPESDEELIPTAIISQPIDLEICEGDVSAFEFLLEGTGLSFQWQVNDGNGWTNLQNGAEYDGVMSSKLVVIDPVLAMSGYQYRCIVNGPCNSPINSSEVSLTVNNNPEPIFDFDQINTFEFQFNNITNSGTICNWDFGDGNISDELSPYHVYQNAGNYEVILTCMNNCGEVSTSQEIIIGSEPTAAFTANFNNSCAPVTVEFSDNSTGDSIDSYLWQFEGGFPSTSTQQNPVVVYNNPGEYDVILTVANMFGESTLVINDFVEIYATPSADFDFVISNDTVDFIDNSSGATFWFWEFGDGATSTEMNPTYIYQQSGGYQVTLTVGNQNCGSAISQEIFIETANSTSENQALVLLRIYPNPTSGNINCEFSNVNYGSSFLSLYDFSGKKLREVEISDFKTNIDLSGIANGIYLLKVQIGENQFFQKVVKSN